VVKGQWLDLWDVFEAGAAPGGCSGSEVCDGTQSNYVACVAWQGLGIHGLEYLCAWLESCVAHVCCGSPSLGSGLLCGSVVVLL
jgi:hypothetical protein